MGRLPKKGVDYFPHDVFASSTPTLFIVQQEYGNDGYAFWFKLLEFIGKQKGLYADFSIKKDWLYFLSIAKVDADKGEAIMTALSDLDAIDKPLWTTHRIAWSDNFVSRLASLFCRRGTPLPTKPEFDDLPTTPTGEGTGETSSPKKGKGKKKAKTETVEKTQYAEFVSMLESEYTSLVEKVGKTAADKCIEVLDNYKGSKGTTYKSDYRAILNWVIDKVQKEHPQLFRQTVAQQEVEGGNPFDEYDGG